MTTAATLVLYLVLFLVAIALVYVVGRALWSTVFELTPPQFLAIVILVFAAGALLVAYLDGNGAVELLAAIPMGIVFVWFVASIAMGHHRRSSAAAGEE